MRRRSWLRQRQGERVVVHTLPPSDQSIDGALDHVGTEGLILRDARFLGVTTEPAAGELYVPWERIALLQATSRSS